MMTALLLAPLTISPWLVDTATQVTDFSCPFKIASGVTEPTKNTLTIIDRYMF